MTIEQRFDMLSKWCNNQMVLACVLRNDAVIRDTIPITKKDVGNQALMTHALRFSTPRGEGDINHGWGKLKEGDKQIGNLQLRYNRDYKGVSFEEYCKNYTVWEYNDRRANAPKNSVNW